MLAVRASRLGDLLLTTPALRAFKERWPETRVVFLTNSYCRELLAGNPDVDEILAFDGREADLAGRTGRRLAGRIDREIDLLLALRPRPELVRFAHAVGIPYCFPASDPSPLDRSRHVVEQCLARLAPLDVDPRGGPLVLPVTDAERAWASSLLPPGDGPILLCHPGCDETFRLKPRRGTRRRLWPVDRWRRLIDGLPDRLGARVLVTSGSPVEARWVERILRGCRARPAHLPGPPVRALAALASLADLVITIDTGPLHVATAVGTRVIGLYGPSPPAYTGPWSPTGRATSLRRDLPCAPCQGHGVLCLRNVCMEEITVDEVLAAAQAALRDVTPSGAALSPTPGRSTDP